MSWDHEKCIQLIKLYELKPELWKTNHKFYHLNPKKQDAWVEISSQLDCDVGSIKSKMNSLLSSYRREKNKHEKSIETGKGK